MKQPAVYIMASSRNGTLYVGSTTDLIKRVWEHKNSFIKGFTAKYKVFNLVYFEEYNDIHLALEREIQLKRWRRQWKLSLIEKDNPLWNDLYEEIIA